MCCGGRRPRVSDVMKADIKMVKAVYQGSGGRHSVFGASRVLGRPIDYGYRSNGDVFNVAVADVIAQPSLFLAYPCRKPFIVKGDEVEIPCGEMEPKDSVGTIEGLPGIGKKTAQRLAKMGIVTPDDVLNNVDDDILNGLPPRSRSSIKKWQATQRGLDA